MLPYILFTFFVIGVNTHEIPSPPSIIKQPNSKEILLYGDDATIYLECEAFCKPACKYAWIKNGKPFDWESYGGRIKQHHGIGTLIISLPQTEDIGQYGCTAENKLGIATTDIVFIRKIELHQFNYSTPLNITATEGIPYKFTCVPPFSYPKMKANWVMHFKSGEFRSVNNPRMTVDPEGNLWFSNLTILDSTSDDFRYVCVMTSFTRLTYKFGPMVILEVLSSEPKIISEMVFQYVSPEKIFAQRLKEVELFCIYGGTPLPTTVWKKDGKPIEYSKRIRRNNYGKSLLIKFVDFADEGQYSCHVSNRDVIGMEHTISLNVLSAPEFIEEPQSVYSQEGTTAQLRCYAYGEPEPEIIWTHNGKPISQDLFLTMKQTAKNLITFQNLSKSDTGNYGCNATNFLGYSYKDIFVNVLERNTEFEYNVVVDGKSIKITCRAFGDLKQGIRWNHNGNELRSDRYRVLENGDLSIKNVQIMDTGNYTCSAVNKFGINKATSVLVVKRHTYIENVPIVDSEVFVGKNTEFKCNVVHDKSLPLKIIWQKDDKQIDIAKDNRYVNISESNFIITNTKLSDSANYTCIAKTSLDEIRSHAILRVQDVPSAPILNVQCNYIDALLNWKVKQDETEAPVTHYTIQYSSTFMKNIWETIYDDIPPDEFSYNVAISPWANYTFRIIARNKVGASPPSRNYQTCTTKPNVPYRNPDGVHGQGTHPDNLVIYWIPMPEIDHNAPGFKYRIYWKRDVPGLKYKTLSDIRNWKQNNVTIDRQPSFRRYKFKILALNDVGEANVSPLEVIGYSGEDVPNQSPYNFTLIKIVNTTSAVLGWNAVPINSVRGYFVGYKIIIWNDNSTERRYIHVDNKTTTLLLTDLVPLTRNYAQIHVQNKKYLGPSADILDFKTPKEIEQIKYFEAFHIETASIMLSWNKPDDPSEILTGYKIYYAKLNGTTEGFLTERNPQIDNPNQHTAEIRGLIPKSHYRFYISTTSLIGESKKYFIDRYLEELKTFDFSKFVSTVMLTISITFSILIIFSIILLFVFVGVNACL